MLRFFLAGLLVAWSCTFSASAVEIVIDYTYDNTNFFGAGNPAGSAAGVAAKASLEEAARFLSESLEDAFSEIHTPEPYHSSVFNGVATWEWSLNFNNPSTGSTVTLYDETIAADEYRIYAGARSIAGSTIGIGGPGGWGWSTGGNGGGFTSSEIDSINSITNQFGATVEHRGEQEDEFSRWGGAITFDLDSSTDWHWDWTTPVGQGENDFFSVAVHELMHVMGFGASNEWSGFTSGGVFQGQWAQQANGGSFPSVTGGHWAYNTMSTIVGTATSQEALMDPDITLGDRKYLTTLDMAALRDIGWDVQYISPLPDTSLPGDYNNDNQVTAADYTTWRQQYGMTGGLSADGNGDNKVDAADYAIWRNAYVPVALSTAAAIAPEPAALGLWLLGGLLARIGSRSPRRPRK